MLKPGFDDDFSGAGLVSSIGAGVTLALCFEAFRWLLAKPLGKRRLLATERA